MCEPVSIIAGIGLAISAAGTIAGVQAQQSQAKEQRRYAALVQAAAQEETRNKVQVVDQRLLQEQEAFATERQDIAREGMRHRATMATQMGEANIAGLSVEGLLADAWGQEADARNRVATNYDWTARQLELEKRGIVAQGKTQANSVRTQRGANWFDAGLRIGGAGLDAYSTIKRYSPSGSGGAKTTVS